jgi:hypothetical protein
MIPQKKTLQMSLQSPGLSVVVVGLGLSGAVVVGRGLAVVVGRGLAVVVGRGLVPSPDPTALSNSNAFAWPLITRPLKVLGLSTVSIIFFLMTSSFSAVL